MNVGAAGAGAAAGAAAAGAAAGAAGACAKAGVANAMVASDASAISVFMFYLPKIQTIVLTWPNHCTTSRRTGGRMLNVGASQRSVFARVTPSETMPEANGRAFYGLAISSWLVVRG